MPLRSVRPTASRRIDENAPKGTSVGAPVIATDPDLEEPGGNVNRKVTYWLGGEAGANDNALFSIDPASGQIMVEVSQNFEDPEP